METLRRVLAHVGEVTALEDHPSKGWFDGVMALGLVFL
jgi:hypothetical protein